MMKWNCELIETLWNVNLFTKIICYLFQFELIETLWNVNTYKEIKEAGIQLELIETLWNVNKQNKSYSMQKTNGINRNIVECKCVNQKIYSLFSLELIETLWNVNSNTTNSCFLFAMN